VRLHLKKVFLGVAISKEMNEELGKAKLVKWSHLLDFKYSESCSSKIRIMVLSGEMFRTSYGPPPFSTWIVGF